MHIYTPVSYLIYKLQEHGKTLAVNKTVAASLACRACIHISGVSAFDLFNLCLHTRQDANHASASSMIKPGEAALGAQRRRCRNGRGHQYSPADVEDNPQVAFGHVIDGLVVGTCRSGTTDQHQADGQERDAGEHDDGVGRRAEPGDRL